MTFGRNLAVMPHDRGHGVETLGIGEVVGWSWMFPPYLWSFGAVAAAPVEAVAFDAAAVRARCAADPLLGLELNWRLTRVIARRLQTTRIRLLSWHELTEDALPEG